MLQLLSVFCLLAVAIASDVLELGDTDFHARMEDEDFALVKFYAPWCGHCKKLAPEFETAATALKNNDPPVTLVKVDCTAAGKSVCDEHKVSGFPTLKAFKKGELAFDYNGPRDSDGIVKYMRSKAGPSSKTLTTVADVEKLVGGDEHVVVGFFDKDSSIKDQFQKLADALNEDFRFGHTSEPDVLENYGFKDDLVIFHPARLNSKFEENRVKYDGDATLHKMKSWVNDNVHGLCGHRTTSNQDQFKKPLVVAYYNVDYIKNAKGTNYWRNRVMKVGKKLTDEGKKVYFAVSSKDDFSYELSEFGLTSSGDTPVVAARNAADQKFIMKADFSMENLEKFVVDFLEGKVDPYLKSEPVPDDNSGPVKVVVAKNFDEIVNDETKDVLIEFYAPWCGHCKNLAPKYEELGEKLSGESSVVIAKMDATANDVPKPYEVRGFPTLYYAPKDSKKAPKKYEGGREVDDFMKFMARESTDGLKGWDRKGKAKKEEL